MSEPSLPTPPGADALAEFNAAFSHYLVWSQKEQGAAIEDRGRKVRFELYRLFRATAKTPGALRAEVEGLGWAIRRRVDGGTAAEYPNAAAVGAVPRVSPEEEIALRVRSLRFLSASWIFRTWKASSAGQRGRFTSFARGQKVIGSANVATERGNEAPFVSLTSLLEGVVEQNRRRSIADQALRAQAQDMAAYIQRKHQEQLQRTFARTYSVALGAIG